MQHMPVVQMQVNKDRHALIFSRYILSNSGYPYLPGGKMQQQALAEDAHRSAAFWTQRMTEIQAINPESQQVRSICESFSR